MPKVFDAKRRAVGCQSRFRVRRAPEDGAQRDGVDNRPAEGEAQPRPGRGIDAGDEADRLESDAGGHGDAECGDPGRGGRVEENAVDRHAAGDDVVYYGGPVGEESEASARVRALAAG